jgi:hypothetical protein
MSSLPLKVLASIVVAIFAFASPTDAAKKSKHKKVATSSTITRTNPQYRGTNLVPPAHFISAAYISAMIPTQISASSFCETSAVGSAATIDRPACLTKAL